MNVQILDNVFIHGREINQPRIAFLSNKLISLEEIGFIDKNSILGRIISQNSGCYLTKDEKVIRKLDRIFIFEKIKKMIING